MAAFERSIHRRLPARVAAVCALLLAVAVGAPPGASAAPTTKDNKTHTHRHSHLRADLTVPKPTTRPSKLPVRSGPLTARGSVSAESLRGTDFGTQDTSKVQLKPLVIALDNADYELATARTLLDRIGTPYDVLLARSTPLTADRLMAADGVGLYSAIILTSHSLLYDLGGGNYVSAFDADEWNLLWAYERDYKVRQVSLYTSYGTFPEDYCLRGVSEGGVGDTPVNASLTAVGAQLFDYLKPTAQVPIIQSYVYTTSVADGCAARPIITTPNGVLGVLSTATDGRERLALTFTTNQYLTHTNLLAHAIVKWATKGVFLGEEKRYLGVDVDDWFNSTDHLLPDGTYGPEYRLTGSDVTSAKAQQAALRTAYPVAAPFTLNIPYNGEGIRRDALMTCPPLLTGDPLTAQSFCLRNDFRWVNHTFTHPKMNNTPYQTNYDEIRRNRTAASQLGLSQPNAVLKTPEYSGLGVYHPDPNNDIDPPTDYGLGASNVELLRAAKALNVKYLHGNMSFNSHKPSCHNCSVIHPLEPAIEIVPDWPTNIAYHVTNPAEETFFYNSYYGPNGKFPYWPRDLTYAELLDYETGIGLQHVMTGSAYVHTLHQGNLREYAPNKSLTFDWVTQVVAKYNAYFKVGLKTPAWNALAQYTSFRTSHFGLLGAGAKGVWDRTTNAVTVTSPAAGSMFVTGAQTGASELYGTDRISRLTLVAGTPVTFTPIVTTGP